MKDNNPTPLFSISPDKKLNNSADFLAALGKKLPDRLLAGYFPGLEVKVMRRMLHNAVEELAEKEKKSSSTTSTAYTARPQKAKTQAGSFSLYTDGASRGNPGKAGAGVVILNEQGEELAARSFYLGQCSNNVAEYKALISGLREATKLGCRQLDIFLDSQLIVRQILGQYKVKNAGLKPLYGEVRQLLTNFTKFTISHVPRNENKRADELANRGIDERHE